MVHRMLIINVDNCYILDYFTDIYLGPIIRRGYCYLFWINNKYDYFINRYDDQMNKQNIYIVRWENYEPIPKNIEILIVESLTKHLEKLPVGLKVFCYLEKPMIQFNFPIGLKYLCLSSSISSDIINKIKIPFGCKLILF
jgi:hypothetical protein